MCSLFPFPLQWDTEKQLFGNTSSRRRSSNLEKETILWRSHEVFPFRNSVCFTWFDTCVFCCTHTSACGSDTDIVTAVCVRCQRCLVQMALPPIPRPKLLYVGAQKKSTVWRQDSLWVSSHHQCHVYSTIVQWLQKRKRGQTRHLV